MFQIRVKGELDRENKTEYVLKVRATDNATDVKERKSNETTITVEIDDVNDNCPEFTKHYYNVVVTENQKISTSIATVSAKDKDYGENSSISYKIDDGNNDDLFKINNATGVIYVNKSLSDKIGKYNITVVANDHGNPSLNGTADLFVEVTDENTHKPKITNIPNGNTINVYEVKYT